ETPALPATASPLSGAQPVPARIAWFSTCASQFKHQLPKPIQAGTSSAPTDGSISLHFGLREHLGDLFVERLLGQSRDGDGAREDDLADAERPEQVNHGADLVPVAGRFNDHAFVAHVNDFGAEDADQAQDFLALGP